MSTRMTLFRSPSMTVQATYTSHVTCLAVRGHLTVDNHVELRAAVRDVRVPVGAEVHLHLDRMAYADNCGVAALAEFADDCLARGHPVWTFGSEPGAVVVFNHDGEEAAPALRPPTDALLCRNRRDKAVALG